MNVVKAFLDTNIFIYIYSNDDFYKNKVAKEQINKYFRIISTQVLSEFCNVCIRKLKLDLHAVEVTLNEICDTNIVSVINEDTVKQALYIHSKYLFNYYDSLIVASALENKCEYLLSEDMSDGLIIEKTLTIRNIFTCNNP
jgi:predicted nucleic acid-binding protein